MQPREKLQFQRIQDESGGGTRCTRGGGRLRRRERTDWRWLQANAAIPASATSRHSSHHNLCMLSQIDTDSLPSLIARPPPLFVKELERCIAAACARVMMQCKCSFVQLSTLCDEKLSKTRFFGRDLGWTEIRGYLKLRFSSKF